jgi:hypothetical protein
LDWIELVIMVDSDSDVPLMEETVRVDPVIVVKYPVVVDKVGTWTEDRTFKEEVTWISLLLRRLFTVIPFTVTVDPESVENTPDVNEKDEIIIVEFTVNWFVLMVFVEMDEKILYSVKSVEV